MFTWICPKCGKEVQPSDDECPYCREAVEKQSDAGSPDVAAKPEVPKRPEPPVPSQRQPAASPQPARGQSPPAQQTRGMVAMPGWAVALIVAVGLIGVGSLFYVLLSGGSSEPATTPSASESPFLEVPETGAAPGSETQSMVRYIEATGFRVTEDPSGRLEVRFLIVNHSAADFGDVAGTVYLRSADSETTYTSVDFRTTGLGPYESIEFSVVRSSNIRAYEIPEWWNLRGDLEITYPAGFE